jgi:thiamine-phosphate pyrophosphorylase
MPRRHPPLPRLWLMTDERMGESLWQALARLPRGSGIVFRHYGLAPVERRRLFERVQAVARRRRLVLVQAGNERLGRGPCIVHNGGRRTTTAAVHTRREAIAAIRAGAELLFVSPVFPTRSHPDAATLGPIKLGLLIRGLRVPVIALGGMNARKARRLGPIGVHGWAAIDAWARA